MADVENSIELNDAIFCSQHFKEVCNECDVDFREENDGFFGGLEAPASSTTKDGTYQCKKHGSASCSQCYGWKKQITRARVAAKKAGGKKH
ncbi:hypothetical protein BD626DRAFT_507515 [Schizophyllum amplum]|uniref:Uncharacterized protein n=1 Tax=Schizophyllum amplum TaxID=97359 RepID=A0A550C449_9AGAR|nr:hypothetical protein BD626DRAFT_507515 [Auriculariopsis ampla]